MSWWSKFHHVTVLLVFCSLKVNFIACLNQELNPENWNAILNGEWLVKFYAPWCPACRALETTWEELASWAEKEEIVSVASVDVTSNPGLNGRFMITALPTIYHVKDGVFRQYRNSRSLEDLKNLISKKEWENITPVSQWLSPTSAIMGGIGKLFDISTKLKELQETLSNDYGFPTWVGLLLFGLIIIIIGLLLGVGLVLATDYIWGPPQPPHYLPSQPLNDDDDDTKDLSNDTEKKVDDIEENEKRDELNGESIDDPHDKEEELNLRRRNFKVNSSD